MRWLVAVVLMFVGCHGRAVARQLLPIGSACDGDARCGTAPFACADDHPSGYCVAECQKDGECPAGSICVGGNALAMGACHKLCSAQTAASDCRASEGYVCSTKGYDASHDYCDTPGPRALLRRARSRSWR